MWQQNFMKNLYLGTELTDEQLKDIPYPREELHFYVLHKNVQVSFKSFYSSGFSLVWQKFSPFFF